MELALHLKQMMAAVDLSGPVKKLTRIVEAALDDYTCSLRIRIILGSLKAHDFYLVVWVVSASFSFYAAYFIFLPLNFFQYLISISYSTFI